MTNEENKTLSIKEFTKAAADYESDHAGLYEMCKKDYPDILEELENESFSDLLDAGYGPAPMISLLTEKYPDRHYTGLDLIPAMIEQAKKKNIPNAVLWLMDKIELPFANLCGHGDVKIATREKITECCRMTGLKVEKFEIRKGMRLHCVVRNER